MMTLGELIAAIGNSLLSPARQAVACLPSEGAGAEYLITSTGFGAAGTVAGGARCIRETIGVRSRTDLEPMIRAGACCIGSSSGVRSMHEYGLGKA